MPLPLAKSDESSISELRAESRTHLFLVAMLSAGTVLMPVHIRNLSTSGALIEGSVLPAAGAVVSIRRGGLSVDGVVAWRSQTQAGIAFRVNIFVPAWLPSKSSAKQCAIDQIFHESRNERKVAAHLPSGGCALADPASALAELTFLRSDLVALGDVLVQDIILVATHPEIQLIDIAVQRIDRLMSLTAESGTD